MPHALFLGSSLATQDRVNIAPLEDKLPPPASSRPGFKSMVQKIVGPLFQITHADRTVSTIDYRTKYGERDNNALTFINQHLSHGIADVVTNLIALAIPINFALVPSSQPGKYSLKIDEEFSYWQLLCSSTDPTIPPALLQGCLKPMTLSTTALAMVSFFFSGWL